MKRRLLMVSCLGLALAGSGVSAQIDGHPDLNGVWRTGAGGAPPASSAIQKGNTTVVLFPLEGADPFEGPCL